MISILCGFLVQGVWTSSDVLSLFQLRRSHRQAVVDSEETCDSSWDTFGDGPLQRTSINPSPWNGAMEHLEDWEFPEHESAFVRSTHLEVHSLGIQFLYVDPKLKFAFCPIEKDACSYFDQVMTRMLTRNTSYTIPMVMPADFINIYSVGAISQDRFGLEGIKQVFDDPDATRAVFVRDPLHRFLSAFLNKCFNPTPDEAQGQAGMESMQNCPMYKEGIVFKDAVQWALSTDMNNVNPHWKLQAYHCHLHKYIQSYNVIGVVSHDLSSDAKCLFEKAGLADYNHEFVVDKAGQAKRDDNFRSATKNGQTGDELMKLFFPPDVARQLIQHFAIDYSTFNFDTNPAWLEDATGEYYDIIPPLDDEAHVKIPSNAEEDD